MKGIVHSFESFGAADGPGIRFIVFLTGCALRCKYCHNPDTWNKAGQEFETDEIIKKALRYRPYWKDEGGITVSGGEPLLQIDFLTELFQKAKKEGITTCIDTAGQPFTFSEPFYSKFLELMKVTDTILLDIKHIDNDEHIKLTGKSNENILELFKELDRLEKKVWVRHVLVPGITSDEKWLLKTAEFLRQFKNIERIDVLPYHTLGKFKWEELGLDYQLKDTNPPSKEEIEKAKEILKI